LRRFAHAGAIVRQREAKARGIAEFGVLGELVRLQRLEGQFQFNAALAFRHAVPGMSAQVQDGLLNLGGIGENGGKFPVQIVHDLQFGGND